MGSPASAASRCPVQEIVVGGIVVRDAVKVVHHAPAK
jgi:hypothetical protein